MATFVQRALLDPRRSSSGKMIELFDKTKECQAKISVPSGSAGSGFAGSH